MLLLMVKKYKKNKKQKHKSKKKKNKSSLNILYITIQNKRNISQAKKINKMQIKPLEEFQTKNNDDKNFYQVEQNESKNHFKSQKSHIKNFAQYKKRKILNNFQLILKFISLFIKMKINELMLIYLILSIFSKEIKERKINSYFSNITITIIGSGDQTLYNNALVPPDAIYINNKKLESVNNSYNFKEKENYVKLVWNEKISDCNNLFNIPANIISIDVSDFDFSLGINANCMFAGRTTLKEIIFPTSGIVKINNAGGMFSACNSLISLDVSHFDISSVQDFGNMFKNCHSLTSLDLTSFKFGSSTNLFGMFQYCLNLEYLNLKDVNFIKITNKNSIFKSTKNLVVCSTSSLFISIINSYSNCIVNDCSSNWREKQKRINTENNQCVNNCQGINYKYDYLSKCYPNCPEGTYNDSFICKDCHPDCKTCDKKEEINNSNCKSCLSSDKYLKFGNCVDECINGYYPDENDPSIKLCKCD